MEVSSGVTGEGCTFSDGVRVPHSELLADNFKRSFAIVFRFFTCYNIGILL